MPATLLTLVAAAAIAHLLLAGAGVVRLAVQLPARSRLGPLAFAAYSRAADLGRGGLVLYPLLGAGGPLVTWAALGIAWSAGTAAAVRVPLTIAAGLCALHVFTTSRAAPAMLRIGRSAEPAVISQLMNTFTRWSWARTILQALAAAALTGALVMRPGHRQLAAPVLTAALVAFALVTILAGAALDQTVVHLPVRGRIGTADYAAYLRAVDLRNGRVVYPLVGLSSNAALIAALGLGILQPLPARFLAALGLAVAAGIAAFLTTARAVPAAGQLAAGATSAEAAAVDRFVAAARARAPLFFLTFASLLWVAAAG